MSARAIIKNAVKIGAYGISPLLPKPRPASRVLTYHSIGALDHAMNVTPAAFAEQMAWLADNVHVHALDNADDALPGVAITFDDGYRDNLTNAAPILSKLNLSATIFVVAGKMGETLSTDADPVHGRLMTWEETRALADMNFEIGAHTMTHRRLSQITDVEQAKEIVGSCTRIAQEIGTTVRHFAYPYGTAADYNALSMRLAQEAGCSAGYSNRYGYNIPETKRYELKRIWIDASDDLTTFRWKVTGAVDALQLLESKPVRVGRRMFSKIG